MHIYIYTTVIMYTYKLRLHFVTEIHLPVKFTTVSEDHWAQCQTLVSLADGCEAKLLNFLNPYLLICEVIRI